MPIVGQAIRLVMSTAIGSTTPSITTAKAPASATAVASATILAASSGVRPRAPYPPSWRPEWSHA